MQISFSHKKRELTYLYLLLSIFSVLTIALYWLIRGKLGVTFSPVQPDSATYICRGLEFARLDHAEKERILGFINSHFRPTSDWIENCGEVPSHYQARILLPALIAIFSLAKLPFLIVLPTVLFALFSILIWWEMTRKQMSKSNFLVLLGVAPWISPHFGGHAFLVLTEGPLMFFLLCILVSEKIQNRSLYFFSLTTCLVLGITNRQSWPILAVFVAYALSSKFKLVKPIQFFFLYPAILGIAACLNLTMPSSPSYSIAISDIKYAIWGLANGLTGDATHVIKFLDLPGLIVLFTMVFVIIKYRRLDVLLPSLLLLSISLYSIGGVYLFDGSYSQNWRYFLPNGFFAIYILLLNLGESFPKKTHYSDPK